MAYTISYTDEPNKGTITIEDGTINTETSLRIPGRNTTAYGAVIAENFLHLLENFADTTQPASPTEGQLWYDTTLGAEQLKVYDGTNWVPASGITKQINTPASAQDGDLWVDTDNQQLYLFTGGGWILVGPQFSEGLVTGTTATQIVGTDNQPYTVLQTEVASEVVAIFSNNTSFSPKARIAGFDVINPGLNLINKDTSGDNLSNFKFYGTAEKAENLIVGTEVVQAADFIRGDTTSTTSFPLNVQNNQGINYGVNAELTVGVEGNAGIIQHNIGGSNIDIRVRSQDSTKTIMRLDSGLKVGINNEAPDKELDVTGDIQSSGSIIINGTTESTVFNNGALSVKGGAGIARNVNIGGDLKVSGLVTTANLVPDSDVTRDVGSPTKQFRNIYAGTFIGDVSGNVTGTITGRATGADQLTSQTTFAITGDVESVVDVVFDGKFQDTNFDNGVTTQEDEEGNEIQVALPRGEQPLRKVLRTEISNAFITSKPPVFSAIGKDELIVNIVENSQGLRKISKDDFLKSVPVNPPGVIVPYGGETAPSGWLLCDGSAYDKELFKELFTAIDYRFAPRSSVAPGFFRVPDMRGRMPLGADNMGGTSAGVVTAEAADTVGTKDGEETKIIGISNLPQHEHTLRDYDNNQFYAVRDISAQPTQSSGAGTITIAGNNTYQVIETSGRVANETLSAPFNIMPPTVTVNYIIYTGRSE